MTKILVIDDDQSLLRALRLGLESLGYEVLAASNGEQGIATTALSEPDIVVLDMGLPDMDGQEVCATIRGWSDVPIIVLSATGTEHRKIAALNGGANDYVTKPFSMGELEARIRAALRTHPPSEESGPTEVIAGLITIDLVHREARIGGERISLTAKEFDLLAFLGRHAGRTCTHQMILGAVWGPGYREEAQYVHAYVHRLRQKLRDEAGRTITTVPGVGYCLNVDIR